MLRKICITVIFSIIFLFISACEREGITKIEFNFPSSGPYYQEENHIFDKIDLSGVTGFQLLTNYPGKIYIFQDSTKVDDGFQKLYAIYERNKKTGFIDYSMCNGIYLSENDLSFNYYKRMLNSLYFVPGDTIYWEFKFPEVDEAFRSSFTLPKDFGVLRTDNEFKSIEKGFDIYWDNIDSSEIAVFYHPLFKDKERMFFLSDDPPISFLGFFPNNGKLKITPELLKSINHLEDAYLIMMEFSFVKANLKVDTFYDKYKIVTGGMQNQKIEVYFEEE